MVNRYAGPGLLQTPTIGSRDSVVGRERDDTKTDAVGVAEGAVVGLPRESVHPAEKTQPMQRTIRHKGPIFCSIRI